MRVRILCFGNLLAGDDGFGIHMLQRLNEAQPVRPGLKIELVDAGLLGMSALGYFEACERVIVVDALGSSTRPGHVRRLELSELAAPEAAFSAHALDLTHLFHVLPILFEGRASPPVVIIGAEIELPRGAFSMQLSAAVNAALVPALALIERELDACAAAAHALHADALVVQSSDAEGTA